MLKKIKHKGLAEFWVTGNGQKLPATMRTKIKYVLHIIDDLEDIPEDFKLYPAFRAHQLKGNRKGTWAVDITGNWRITFKIKDNDVYDVDLEDYH